MPPCASMREQRSNCGSSAGERPCVAAAHCVAVHRSRRGRAGVRVGQWKQCRAVARAQKQKQTQSRGGALVDDAEAGTREVLIQLARRLYCIRIQNHLESAQQSPAPFVRRHAATRLQPLPHGVILLWAWTLSASHASGAEHSPAAPRCQRCVHARRLCAHARRHCAHARRHSRGG
jgi:hypothetical protein